MQEKHQNALFKIECEILIVMFLTRVDLHTALLLIQLCTDHLAQEMLPWLYSYREVADFFLQNICP